MHRLYADRMLHLVINLNFRLCPILIWPIPPNRLAR
jgi:hypothetical protein